MRSPLRPGGPVTPARRTPVLRRVLVVALVVVVAAGGAVALGFDLGSVTATASSRHAKAGSSASPRHPSPTPAPNAVTPQRVAALRRVVVVGDSTAAGLGNRPLAHASADDRACGRSRDAFAVDLAQARHWSVTNLACSGATIRAGVLGAQTVGKRTLPAQLTSPALARAQLVIVDIGANDVDWTSMLELCAVSASCSGSAEQAYFHDELFGFSADYVHLVDQLRRLPSHPLVLINLYYDPISGDVGCLTTDDGTAAKQKTLQDDLAGLNTILAAGARTAGFAVGRPDFAGHGVCSPTPDVQGMADNAPFHPTASGGLVIARADERALGLR